MKYFLGVDVGNTKSHALIVDELGHAVGFGHSGPGSWEAVGWRSAQDVLNEIVNQALLEAGIAKEDISGAGFGFAGYDWPEDRPGHVQLVDSLELTKASFTLGNDTLVGLLAGAKDGWGVVVVAGTSNNCRGWDRDGKEGRVTGQGSFFGEFGGALEVVHRAILAISLAWSKRGPLTALSQAFVDEAGATDLTDLFAGLVRNRYELSASIAPLVFDIADQGDAVANEIIRWAGRELGGLANGVIRQLALENETFDVILSGSLYKGSPTLIDEMSQSILAVAPNARLLPLKWPPVIGGVILGMEQVKLETPVIRQTLIETTSELLKSKGLSR